MNSENRVGLLIATAIHCRDFRAYPLGAQLALVLMHSLAPVLLPTACLCFHGLGRLDDPHPRFLVS